MTFSPPRSTRCASLSRERDRRGTVVDDSSVAPTKVRGEALAELVVRDARDRGCRIALAESCTGGLLGARITDIPGSSAVFWGSVVSYSNEAKVSMLGVLRETLEAHGAVSEPVAVEMAEGVRRRSGAEVGLSVSGIAGPDGGTEEKPVGTVWICCVTGWTAPVCRSFRFSGNRRSVRMMAVQESLRLIGHVLAARALSGPG